jgi:uncharacterized protein (TIGR02246 family)
MFQNFFLLSFLFVCLTIAAAGQGKPNDEAALKSLVDQMTTAQADYDPATLDRLFTADYIEISPAGEFDPRAKVLTFYTSEWKAKNNGMTISIEESYPSIRIFGSTGVVITQMAYTMSKDGQTRPGPKMMATIVVRKDKGVWKIASAQYTGIRAAAAATPAAKPQ